MQKRGFTMVLAQKVMWAQAPKELTLSVLRNVSRRIEKNISQHAGKRCKALRRIYRLPPLPPTSPALDASIDVRALCGCNCRRLGFVGMTPAVSIETFARFQAGFLSSEDFHRFLSIFIDFHRFSLIFIDFARFPYISGHGVLPPVSVNLLPL